MVGRGPGERRWRRLAQRLGISENIDWIPWLPQAELLSVYSTHDIFLFPSLRDSGGMVVLEAMAQGLPIVCLKLGGPAKIVKDDCGYVIPTSGQSTAQVSAAVSEALRHCADNPRVQRELRAGALKRAQEFTWSRQITALYRDSHKVVLAR